ncbi:hypothetical protein DID76_03220 [Candidatus Marinamargulisbacteria bacterium SCGC AG-414-C22]|nr:hypothetical protein DID76_03220 [Candidatus Marinamargulisbacteria bacterium SCGC AG-414-C22]
MDMFSDVSAVSNPIDPTTDFLKYLTNEEASFTPSFSDFYQESSNKKPSHQFVQTDDLRFKFEENVQQRSSSVSDESETVSSTVVSNNSELISEDVDSHVFVPVFVNVITSPVNVFLAQLPQHLSSFINRFVEIIKQYNAQNDSLDQVRARFPSLNIDVVFSQNKHNDLIHISLYIGSDNMKEHLKDAEQYLQQFLEKKLDNSIDLELIFQEYSTADEQHSHSQQDESENDTENEFNSLNDMNDRDDD